MENIIQGQKNWNEFKTNGRIGVIGTLFTEQFLKKSYDIYNIGFDNFKADIELNNIDTVFIDNDLYESDHVWYKKNRGNIINFLKNSKRNIVVVKNTTKDVANIFKRAFILNISLSNKNYVNHGYIVEAPILINEDFYCPVGSKFVKDVVYLNIASGSVKKTHNINFNITTTNCTKINLSRELLQNLFMLVKESKVLYINHSKLLDEKTLKFIELIAYTYGTHVIFDSKYALNEKMFNVYSQPTTDNLLYALLKNTQFSLKQAVSKQRETMRINSMILNPDLESFLKGISLDKEPEISVITPTNRKKNLLSYIDRLNKQNFVKLDVIIVTHGFELNEVEINNLKSNFQHSLKIISRESNISLGKCLNAAIELTQYPVIAKIDDDDYYYKNYLFDQWLALQYSNAEIVGKSASFYYFERDDMYILRRINEHSKFCDHVMGATIMSPSSIMKKFMFSDLPRAVDTDYINRVKEGEGKLYATHPYEMCVFRAHDQSKHTWVVDDISLFRHASVMGYGDPELFVAERALPNL